jgi:phosphoglycerate kinase
MKYLKDLSLNGKKVLIRADFNVPLNDALEITDDNRIKQFIPTLKAIVEAGGKPIVMSHFGSPGGKVDPALSLKPCAKRLGELAKMDVVLAPNCIGSDVEALAQNLENGRILLLENLRFHAGEESNDPQFAAALAKLGEVFVGDAFATAHRKHASMVGVPALFKERGAGLLMQAEMEAYEKALVKPKSPLCVILGGSKVSTKLNILINIAQRADKIIIGGAMANTFLAAQGYQVGRSLYEKELIPKVLELLGSLARRDCKVYLPVDVVVGPSLSAKGLGRPVPVQEMPADLMALDIGPATSLLYKEALTTAETVVWNGPMGAFETEDYAKGTTDMIENVAASHAVTIVGGGDTDAAIHQMELAHKFTHISTGGGAFLQLLEGKGLPGFTALS